MVSKEAQEQAIHAIRERFLREPELIDLRLKAFHHLQDYWRAYYQAIHVRHVNYDSLVNVLMTEDSQKSGSQMSGPLPLFFAPEPEIIKKYELTDYRELNDHRAAIISLDSGEVNEGSLSVLMGLDRIRLSLLNWNLPYWLKKFSQIKPQNPMILACGEEMERNPLWQRKEYFEFTPQTLAAALQDLGKEFFALKRE